MTRSLRSIAIAASCVLWATAAGAQTTSATQTALGTSSAAQSSSSTATTSDTRPATTTFFGDTGLWFVPTAEVLPSGKWSVSGYRRGTDYIQGYTNVADFAGTFGVGIKDRAEIFGSFLVDTRIDRDTVPLFFSNPTTGGFIDRYPQVNQPWSGDHVGDLYVGAKVNLMSEWQQHPVALAVRGIVKLPTASTANGNGTGKVDGAVDFIVSKEAAKVAELSGFVGVEGRGQPDGYSIPSSAFRYGVGLGVPVAQSRAAHGGTGRVREHPAPRPPSPPPRWLAWMAACPRWCVTTENLRRATLAVTFQAPKGFFAGVGLSYSMPTLDRNPLNNDGRQRPHGRLLGLAGADRLSPGRARLRAAASAAAAPAAATAAPAAGARAHPHGARRTAIRARWKCCMSSTVTATPMDSIGCAVTYRWTTPTGTLATPTARQSQWTAPQSGWARCRSRSR